MIPIYVRKFNLNHYEDSDTYKHAPSYYFPKTMVFALKNGLGKYGHIRYDDYIIGPLFKSGDFQIGMTGTVEEKEDFYNAISREMGEEIGLLPKDDTSLRILKTSVYERQGEKITFNVYNAYIRDCTPVLQYQDNACLNKQKDSRDKVGCFIYGCKQDVLNFLNSNIYRYKSEDDIVGLVAIKAGDIFFSFKKKIFR